MSVSKAAFTRYRNNLKTVGNLTVKNSLQDFDAKESLSKSIENVLFDHFFECSHDAVSKLRRLEFRFQNLPFSKSAGKNVPVLCEREAYPSHFSPFSKCAGIV